MHRRIFGDFGFLVLIGRSLVFFINDMAFTRNKKADVVIFLPCLFRKLVDGGPFRSHIIRLQCFARQLVWLHVDIGIINCLGICLFAGFFIGAGSDEEEQ